MWLSTQLLPQSPHPDSAFTLLGLCVARTYHTSPTWLAPIPQLCVKDPSGPAFATPK